MEFTGVKITREMFLENEIISVDKNEIDTLIPEIDDSCIALKKVMEFVSEINERYESAYEGESRRMYGKAYEVLWKRHASIREQMSLLVDTLNIYNCDNAKINQSSEVKAGGNRDGKL